MVTENEARKPGWLYDPTVPDGDRLVLSKEMVRSKAFISLGGAAKQILLESYMRLRLDKWQPKRRDKNSVRYFATNNGKLTLSYKSIEGQYGYSSRTISKAIDQLTQKGFWSIVELGCGVKRQSHKIALITNWQSYGTDTFKPGLGKSRRGPVNHGFKKKRAL